MSFLEMVPRVNYIRKIKISILEQNFLEGE